jgi:CHAD domain-containing protein
MSTSAILVKEKRVGLSYWMEEVLDLCAKAEQDLSSDPVHDLRTALRRCRSLADGIRVFDRDPAWKKMRRSAKELFGSLGELRDAHVMMEWAEKLSPPADAAASNLIAFLTIREQSSQKSAATALQSFDHRQWKNWAAKLPSRADRIPPDSPVFAHLALERWQQAHDLHVRALRNRTNVCFHDLRIAVKRFRYILENFLPAMHVKWIAELKEIQDVLGDIHDLDVLWETAIRIHAFPDAAARAMWRTLIQEKRNQRLAIYRGRMMGKESLWALWRTTLPREDECRSLGFERLKIWAGFLDPKISHAGRVSQLALQLYDGLPMTGNFPRHKLYSYRSILAAAAWMHDVGRSKTNSGYHKLSARLVRKLAAPLGWTAGDLRLAALVVRYHRGALPRVTQTEFAALSPSRQRLVQLLAGILRLACACDWEYEGRIRRLQVESSDPVITVRAQGYVESTSLAEHIAAARHLLELTYRRPIFVLAAEEPVTEAPKVQAQAA